MIYTVGNTESYEKYFKEQKYPKKKGKDFESGYEGGSVWKTESEARKHCSSGYSVYGVEAEWEKDTESIDNQEWNNLMIDSLLIKLERVKS